MKNIKSLIIYAMVGPMGSGKTTLALEISKSQGEHFYSLDNTIREFGLPILDLAGYERLMVKALEIIGLNAKESLRQKIPVVLDFGGGMAHWQWLKSIAIFRSVALEAAFSSGAHVCLIQLESFNIS